MTDPSGERVYVRRRMNAIAVDATTLFLFFLIFFSSSSLFKGGVLYTVAIALVGTTSINNNDPLELYGTASQHRAALYVIPKRSFHLHI